MSTKYTADHEWVTVEGDVATVGVTNYAQEQMGDVVFVEGPAVGDRLDKGGESGVIESVKAASETYAPLSGEVVEINEDLEGDPTLINSAPETDGWMYKIKLSDAGELEDLMDKTAYDAHVEDLG